jgi:hypothetical protein
MLDLNNIFTLNFLAKHLGACFWGEIVPQGKLVLKATPFLPKGKNEFSPLKNF